MFGKTSMRSNRTAARLSAVFFASCVAVVLMTSLQARADVYWKVAPPNSGNWSVATNWTGGLPTSSVNAWIINGGTANVTQLGETCGTLSLGGSGSGTVQMTDGSLSTAGYQYVGYSGTGTFTQTGGTNNLSYGYLYLGYNAGGSGAYNLSGSGQLSSPNYEYVGYSGTGSFHAVRRDEQHQRHTLSRLQRRQQRHVQPQRQRPVVGKPGVRGPLRHGDL